MECDSLQCVAILQLPNHINCHKAGKAKIDSRQTERLQRSKTRKRNFKPSLSILVWLE